MTGRHTGALPLGPELDAYNDDRAGAPIRLRGKRHKPAALVQVRAWRNAWWTSPEGAHANPYTKETR